MRRLYSDFARGAPGVGLLLLRLAAGGVILCQGEYHWDGPLLGIAFDVAAVVLGLLLIVGLWTRAAGLLAAGLALGHGLSAPTGLVLPAFSAILGVALALLGPGGWSVDARLFGWRRLEMRDGRIGGDIPRNIGRDSIPG